jgi:hypothetical protein
MSRIVDKQMLLTYSEKERFRKIVNKVSSFSGVEVLTYALMGNHIHLLLMVPEKREFSEEEVIERIKSLYGRERALDVAARLKAFHEKELESDAEVLLRSYTYRMHDLSQFMKMVMQRYTMSYNLRKGRTGHLWENRFKSILIEGRPMALSMMAAYIELNAIRAGLVEAPSQYRFCGFGAAVAGDKAARRGITHLYRVMTGSDAGWKEVLKGYRSHIYMQAEQHRTKGVAIDREKIRKVLEQGGRLSRAEILHCRVRYFSDGAVLGSRTFVEDVFHKYRKEFGQKRKTGARKPRCGDWGELCTMRDLRRSPVLPPG